MDTINIYSIYGVQTLTKSVEDHPDFPNPRHDQGDLRALAEGIARSGHRDTPIVVWERNNETILLDGKRTITAMLLYTPLLMALGEEIPCVSWHPSANNGLTPDQEAMAYMVRCNSAQTETGQKHLTFKEEMAAAMRLKGTGLTNEKIGEILRYSYETIRKLLVADKRLDEKVKDAVGEKITEKTPITKEQAHRVARLPQEEQLAALAKARKAVAVQTANKTDHAAKIAVGKALAKKKIEDVKTSKPLSLDKPKGPVETCEAIHSLLMQAFDLPLDGDNLGGILKAAQRMKAFVKEALRFALALKQELLVERK